MLGTVGNLQTINLIDLFNEYYHELMKYSKLLLFIFLKLGWNIIILLNYSDNWKQQPNVVHFQKVNDGQLLTLKIQT